jgi:N-acetylneuraminic acid mutarotase
VKRGTRWYAILAIGAGTLAGCGDEATQPIPPPATGSAATESAIGSNRWITRADMPSDRTGPAVAVLGNGSGKSVVYAIAGSLADRVRPARMVQAYDVSTNTWSFKANAYEADATNGTGVINGKIYISGGSYGMNYRVKALYQYNPATNAWTRKHDPPGYSYGGVTGVLGGRLYVLTACPDEWACFPVVAKAFWRYDPGSDSWVSLPTPPELHWGGAAGVIGGKFYVVGGRAINDTVAAKKLDVFDPAANRWTTLPGLSGTRSGAASAVLGGKLYVIGGGGRAPNEQGTPVDLVTVKVYDPATKRWTTAARLPEGMGGSGRAAGQVVVNGQARIELVGGVRPGNNLQYIP